MSAATIRHDVIWYRGQSVADAPGAEPRGVLARTEYGAAFAHHARVWHDENGTPCGEWFDNGGTETRYGPVEGLKAVEPARSGVWRPFVGTRIPAALLAQVQGASLNPAGAL